MTAVTPLKDYSEANLLADPRVKLSASSVFDNNDPKWDPSHALPGADNDTRWLAGAPGAAWWSAELPEAKVVGRLEMKLSNAFGDPGDFSLEASVDGSQWQTILERKNESGEGGQMKSFEVDNTKPFRIYKINVTKTMKEGSYPCLASLSFREAKTA
jgi:hypothetical protein